MTRRHLDQVEVHHAATPDGPEPDQFLWRDRLYVVREVLGRWVEAGSWWRGPGARLVLTGAGPSGPALRGSVDDREREVWRVEAGQGSSAGTGVFDLVHETATGRWSLVRVMD